MLATHRFPMIAAPDAQSLWRWLAADRGQDGHGQDGHGQDGSVWLVTWLQAPGAPYLSRAAVLDALIAWGWIDGIRRAQGCGGDVGPGAGRTMQLISPRRHQRWTASCRARA